VQGLISHIRSIAWMAQGYNKRNACHVERVRRQPNFSSGNFLTLFHDACTIRNTMLKMSPVAITPSHQPPASSVQYSQYPNACNVIEGLYAQYLSFIQLCCRKVALILYDPPVLYNSRILHDPLTREIAFHTIHPSF